MVSSPSHGILFILKERRERIPWEGEFTIR
jgi:hypothetical protein